MKTYRARYTTAMRVVWLSLFAAYSFSGYAVDFPQSKGRLYNLSGWDLSELKMSVAADCVDPMTGHCGSLTKPIEWNKESQTFVIPAFSMTADDASGHHHHGYSKPGWGKRYGYHLHIHKVGEAEIAHDLMLMSWENRPGNTFKMMLEELETEFSELTLFAVTKKTTISLSPASAFAGRKLKLRLQKQFFPLEMVAAPEIPRLWWNIEPPALTKPSEELTLTLGPTGFVVHGKPSQYAEFPGTRTVLHVYRERGDAKKKVDFMGHADENCEFSKDGIFGSKEIKIKSELP